MMSIPLPIPKALKYFPSFPHPKILHVLRGKIVKYIRLFISILEKHLNRETSLRIESQGLTEDSKIILHKLQKDQLNLQYHVKVVEIFSSY